MIRTTFYLKYRPQKLAELDSGHVRESLTKIVSSGAIPHAFLFSGPKGTGKTSAARIIAKIVNCESTSLKLRGPRKIEPCNKCEQCTTISKGSNLDVVELDAASHRGIDDARALREAVKLAPAKARKKVYIIDEAHMLTTEASNALLKTLEEPPHHVLFILATTNPEKLIETIRSRATPLTFKKATSEEIVRSLTRVTKGEKIRIDKVALELIAVKSDGSFRDAAKTLEQLVSEKRSLKKEAVEEFLLKVKSLDIERFIDLLIQKDTKALIQEVANLVQKGVLMENLLERLVENFRVALLASLGIGDETLKGLDRGELVRLITLFAKAKEELKAAVIEQLPVELAIIEWAEAPEGGEVSTPKSPPESLLKKETEVPKNPNPKIKEVSEEIWRTILATVKPINTSIEALLRAARPVDFDGKNLTLGVYYRFHKERLEEGNYRRILEDVIASVLGGPVRVICTLTEPPTKKEPVLTEGEDKDIIKIAEEIFGS
ncbi:MAG: DNA polymerase III subunit gamma/tau [Patescibacteria group bacterium]